MRTAKVELTEYQQAFLWMKQHNIMLGSTKVGDKRFVTVANTRAMGIGKTIREAINHYISKTTTTSGKN